MAKKLTDEEFLVRLGEKINSLRKANGLSQEELAERVDTKHTQIGRVERGVVNSSINVLRKIAHELNVSISELVNLDK